MFDLAAAIRNLPRSNKPLRLSVRQLHWLKAAFLAQMQFVESEFGYRYRLDEAALARVFVRWLKSIESQKPSDKLRRRDYFEFAPSLMLKELMGDMPVSCLAQQTDAAKVTPAGFWPEGYLVTTFCLAVCAASIDEEFHDQINIQQMIDDIRSWWSFRENVAEDPTYAAGFFQLILGREPDWCFPTSFGNYKVVP